APGATSDAQWPAVIIRSGAIRWPVQPPRKIVHSFSSAVAGLRRSLPLFGSPLSSTKTSLDSLPCVWPQPASAAIAEAAKIPCISARLEKISILALVTGAKKETCDARLCKARARLGRLGNQGFGDGWVRKAWPARLKTQLGAEIKRVNTTRRAEFIVAGAAPL